MVRSILMAAGCLGVGVLSMCLFMWAAMMRHDDMLKSNELFRWSFIVLGVGTTLIVAAQLLLSWRDVREAEAAQQELIARARRLREERERARQRQHDLLQEAIHDLARTPVVDLDAPMPAAPPRSHTPQARQAHRVVGACPLCQTEIVAGEQYVVCPVCSIPCHEDCWDYNGGCAVRGCAARPASPGRLDR